MRRKIALLISVITLLCTLLSCSFFKPVDDENDDTPSTPDLDKDTVYTVSFYVKDELYSSKSVTGSEIVPLPESPKAQGYLFTGWYLDKACTIPFNQATPITQDTRVFASLTIDGVSITNKITTDVIKSIVTVNNESYNSVWGTATKIHISQGSGVIIDIANGYAYALTSCHVVQQTQGYEHQKITLEDYQGNVYDA